MNKELKKLLENAGMGEGLDPASTQADVDAFDEIADWGDELIEDLKLMIDEHDAGRLTDAEVASALVDIVSQYDQSPEIDPIGQRNADERYGQ